MDLVYGSIEEDVEHYLSNLIDAANTLADIALGDDEGSSPDEQEGIALQAIDDLAKLISGRRKVRAALYKTFMLATT